MKIEGGTRQREFPGVTGWTRRPIAATAPPGEIQGMCREPDAEFCGMGISMPLMRGQIVGHDNERLAFAFTMLNDGETVQCQISYAAMDDLAGVRGTQSIARQAQFVAYRDAIEKVASDLFDIAPSMKGYVVRIFAKHVKGGIQP
jgi:hypothetical protein